MIQPCRTPWSSHRSNTLRRPSLSQLSHKTKHQTVEVPQTQHLNLEAYVPAVSQRQVPTLQTVHKMMLVRVSISIEW